MSTSQYNFENLDSQNYEGPLHKVDVDQTGFYEGVVAMEELCYCVGAVSVHTDEIYAAHVSPGNVGGTPEEKMDEFQEGNENYVVAGVRSLQYDPTTLKTVTSEMEGGFELFIGREFAINEDGEVFEEFEERSRRNPLI